jgi:hypothetical protein
MYISVGYQWSYPRFNLELSPAIYYITEPLQGLPLSRAFPEKLWQSPFLRKVTNFRPCVFPTLYRRR